ncbi:MAG: hypothetical protein IKP28_02260 [Clostridia bacterium]|nr:hypothetical protein [Clostridia bacterium]
MCKKIVITFLIIITFFNFAFNNYTFASTLTLNQLESGRTNTTANQFSSGGGSTRTTETRNVQASNSSFNLIYTVLAIIIVQLPLAGQTLLTLAVLPEDITKTRVFTIEDMLLRKI